VVQEIKALLADAKVSPARAQTSDAKRGAA
jgi:hypothetical protein